MLRMRLFDAWLPQLYTIRRTTQPESCQQPRCLAWPNEHAMAQGIKIPGPRWSRFQTVALVGEKRRSLPFLPLRFICIAGAARVDSERFFFGVQFWRCLRFSALQTSCYRDLREATASGTDFLPRQALEQISMSWPSWPAARNTFP